MNLTRLQMPSANAGRDPLLLSEHAADYPAIGTVPAVHSGLIAIKSNRIYHTKIPLPFQKKRLWSLSVLCGENTRL